MIEPGAVDVADRAPGAEPLLKDRSPPIDVGVGHAARDLLCSPPKPIVAESPDLARVVENAGEPVLAVPLIGLGAI